MIRTDVQAGGQTCGQYVDGAQCCSADVVFWYCHSYTAFHLCGPSWLWSQRPLIARSADHGVLIGLSDQQVLELFLEPGVSGVAQRLTSSFLASSELLRSTCTGRLGRLQALKEHSLLVARKFESEPHIALRADAPSVHQ